MKLPRTRELLPRVDWLESIGSTNAALRELLEREGSALPHGALLATADQTAGRGRQGRDWTTPPGTALAMSILVRGTGAGAGAGAGGVRSVGGATAPDALSASWLPLLAGSAVVAALQPFFGPGHRVGTKWPNDVHVRDEADAEAGRPGSKLCGILCELVPIGGGEPPAVIVGAGINLLIPEWELPSERATSLLAADAEVPEIATLDEPGGPELADRVLSAVAGELLHLVELARTDPGAARTRVLRHSLTLGTEVRVHLPGERSSTDARSRSTRAAS
ncbi:biotin--[acetyl-CoA-carboxylase] ligase [Leucobacter soli]|uniref:biotin--[acetyl-CoA-carboxylase] ligase n=1 Tax=Leucobacter soli TaxID=2812850 RepID=UPI0036170E62